MAQKFKIKKGDHVIIITGRDRGKKGDVIEVLRAENRVRVSGVNMLKKHQKPSATNTGGRIEMEAPIHLSNVALVDPKDGKATRIGYKILDNGEKARIAKRSGEVIT